MEIKKIFLSGIFAIAFVLLGVFGAVGISSTTKQSTAKADGDVPIEYYAISTTDEIFVGVDTNDNGLSVDEYTEMLLDIDNNKISGYKKESGGATITNVGATVNSNITQYISQGYPTTYNNDTETVVGSLFGVNNINIDSTIGWLFEESDTAGVRTLKSLYTIDSNGNIPAGFLSGGYQHNNSSSVRLYCILNPYDIVLSAREYPDMPDSEIKGYLLESESSTTQLTELGDIKIAYLESNRTLPLVTPKDSTKFKFDGYFDKDGNRITDENGTLLEGWTRSSETLYAHYVEVFNITYHFTNNNTTYTGRYSPRKTNEDGTWNVVSLTELNTFVNNNSAATFPASKVIAGWYSNADFEGNEIVEFKENDIEIWAKLANPYYTLTFNSNGGIFWNDSTTVSLVRPFGTTLNDAIQQLRTESATGNIASRLGYSYSINSWTASSDDKTILNVMNTKITDDKTIYLLWTPVKYKLIYHTDGTFKKTGLSSDGTYEYVSYGANLYDYLNPKSDYIPIKDGFNFIGWATANADEQKGFVLNSRPTGNSVAYNSTITLNFVKPTDTMPAEELQVHSVWIEAFTLRLNLNQGQIQNTTLKKNDNLVLTIENGETFEQALERMEVSDFFSNETYKPTLSNCTFVGWCYYKDGNISNNDESNTYLLDSKILTWDKDTLLAHNIDITKDATFAAVYSYNKTDSFYTKAPADTTSTIFAIILMVISVALLIMLILSHKNNGTIEINDRAIDAYKNIYGEDAPLPTFEATKPPFEQNEEDLFASKKNKKEEE